MCTVEPSRNSNIAHDVQQLPRLQPWRATSTPTMADVKDYYDEYGNLAQLKLCFQSYGLSWRPNDWPWAKKLFAWTWDSLVPASKMVFLIFALKRARNTVLGPGAG